ncbi:MAG: pentapeptide repeat-containing protein, partial [Pseudomonadota bacterium]
MFVPTPGSSEEEHSQAVLLSYIAEASRNARTTWFALLGVLVFCSLTLIGIEDADFFGFRAVTALPLIGVSIPTERFFLGAPIAIAALYGYLHLSLTKLWDALSVAPLEIAGQPLRRAVYPWFLMESGLAWRGAEGVAFGTRLSRLSALLAGWCAAPLVLGWFWWRSMPKHDEVLTLTLAACLAVTVWIGWRSLSVAKRMLQRRPIGFGIGASAVVLLLAGVLALVSVIRTEGLPDALTLSAPSRALERAPWLAPTDLRGAVFADRPADWTDYRSAEAAYQGLWAERQRTIFADAIFPETWRETADTEFAQIRATRLAALRGSNFGGRDDLARFERDPENYAPDPGADLRGADLSDAFAPGVSFAHARLTGADMTAAVLEGADFGGADMRAVSLSRAEASLARLIGARMTRALIVGATLRRADLTGAVLENARLDGVDARAADLSETQWAGARVALTDIDGAGLFGADLRGANGFTQEMLHVALGDTDTRVPDGLCRPDHWIDGPVPAGDPRERVW